MSQQIVPLTSDPNQTSTVTLSIDGSFLTLRLAINYSQMAGYWVMKISDQFNNTLIDSIPMITGSYPSANLLEQYQYLQIGACYIINYSQTPLDSPNVNNLGTDFLLLWDDTPVYVNV